MADSSLEENFAYHIVLLKYPTKIFWKNNLLKYEVEKN